MPRIWSHIEAPMFDWFSLPVTVTALLNTKFTKLLWVIQLPQWNTVHRTTLTSQCRSVHHYFFTFSLFALSSCHWLIYLPNKWDLPEFYAWGNPIFLGRSFKTFISDLSVKTNKKTKSKIHLYFEGIMVHVHIQVLQVILSTCIISGVLRLMLFWYLAKSCCCFKVNIYVGPVAALYSCICAALNPTPILPLQFFHNVLQKWSPLCTDCLNCLVIVHCI